MSTLLIILLIIYGLIDLILKIFNSATMHEILQELKVNGCKQDFSKNGAKSILKEAKRQKGDKD